MPLSAAIVWLRPTVSTKRQWMEQQLLLNSRGITAKQVRYGHIASAWVGLWWCVMCDSLHIQIGYTLWLSYKWCLRWWWREAIKLLQCEDYYYQHLIHNNYYVVIDIILFHSTRLCIRYEISGAWPTFRVYLHSAVIVYLLSPALRLSLQHPLFKSYACDTWYLTCLHFTWAKWT